MFKWEKKRYHAFSRGSGFESTRLLAGVKGLCYLIDKVEIIDGKDGVYSNCSPWDIQGLRIGINMRFSFSFNWKSMQMGWN